MPVSAYKMGPQNLEEGTLDRVVHQHITKESQHIWSALPDEIVNKLNKSIYARDLDGYYTSDLGDNIITGSAEEDKALSSLFAVFTNHYWDPDVPNGGLYDEGLFEDGRSIFEYMLDVKIPFTGIIYDEIIPRSNYVKAKGIWDTKIIPLYTGKTVSGRISRIDQDEAYYWLGRVAHLLQYNTN